MKVVLMNMEIHVFINMDSLKVAKRTQKGHKKNSETDSIITRGKLVAQHDLDW